MQKKEKKKEKEKPTSSKSRETPSSDCSSTSSMSSKKHSRGAHCCCIPSAVIRRISTTTRYPPLPRCVRDNRRVSSVALSPLYRLRHDQFRGRTRATLVSRCCRKHLARSVKRFASLPSAGSAEIPRLAGRRRSRTWGSRAVQSYPQRNARGSRAGHRNPIPMIRYLAEWM